MNNYNPAILFKYSSREIPRILRLFKIINTIIGQNQAQKTEYIYMKMAKIIRLPKTGKTVVKQGAITIEFHKAGYNLRHAMSMWSSTTRALS